MTANQINYANLKEAERTHRANEELGARQAAVAERQAAVSEQNLLIQREANQIAAAQVAELRRSHQASEAIQASQVHYNYQLGLLNYGIESQYKTAQTGKTKAETERTTLETQFVSSYGAKAQAEAELAIARTATEQWRTHSEHAKVYQEQIGILDKGVQMVERVAGIASKASNSIMASMYGVGAIG